MTTQTAIALTTIAAPLTKIQLPIPAPKDNELLIKMTASAIAPFDQKLRDLGLFNIGSRLPAVLTYDLVGIVSKHSPELSSTLAQKFPIGAHVMAQASLFNPVGGGLQEYTVIDARFSALVPKNIDDVEAALFPINGFTSFAGLFSSEGGPEGKHHGLGIPFPGMPGSSNFNYANTTLAILGGGTRCGKLAIQFAKLAGIGTIITTAGLNGAAELKKLGATHVVDRHAKDLVSQVRSLTGDGLVYVYDTMSQGDFALPVSILSNSKKGYFSHLLHGKIDEKVLESKKGGVEEWQMNGASGFHPKLAELFWGKIGGWIEGGLNGGGVDGVVEGLGEVGAINKAMDGLRDGGFERWHVRVSS
ncbi:related to alcohol dehydrogenase, zinc-containing [Phialocephala subalpina]|uniref:Related to alcohol dehydrogenase, zinc-containing n=1 Tax=Phialocephala subalpina TaxID=576137 RepID=A0A1L7XAD2_9HELO|nr:related to alcohol dehydrogenase, zinc-containing [Phialocephala subalpina]